MSRVGKLPVELPKNVKVSIEGNVINVEGPKGKLSQEFKPEVEFAVSENEIVVTRKSETKAARSYHGLYRNLLNNMIIGVTKGYSKTLLINGVGYRAELQGKTLLLNLGYSNQIEFMIDDDVEVKTDGNNKVIVSGINKQRVGQIAADIRSLRKPEPYKGKGIRYEDEYVRRKIGKSGVK